MHLALPLQQASLSPTRVCVPRATEKRPPILSSAGIMVPVILPLEGSREGGAISLWPVVPVRSCGAKGKPLAPRLGECETE